MDVEIIYGLKSWIADAFWCELGKNEALLQGSMRALCCCSADSAMKWESRGILTDTAMQWILGCTFV